MKNKNGTTENMTERHDNGNVAYHFITYEGNTEETYFDKNGKAVKYCRQSNYISKTTRDEGGKEVAFKNSDGVYKVKGQVVTQQE